MPIKRGHFVLGDAVRFSSMKRAVLILSVVSLSLSCDGEKFAAGRQMFRELLTLRDQLGKEFHEKVVDVNITNGEHVTVKFINSPLKSRSGTDKQQRANAVAAFVLKHYPHPVSSVTTQFVSKTGGGGVSVAVHDSYVGQLPQPSKAPDAASPDVVR